MVEEKKSTKKAIEIPKTDTSLEEERLGRRYVIWMIVLIIVIILVGGGVIYWLVGNYIQQSNKNKAQDKLIAALEKKLQNLNQLKPNYERIKTKNVDGISDADLILRALPVDKAYNLLIAMIERMAQESGVKVTSITQTDISTQVSGGAAPTEYSVSIAIEGSYEGILEFLRKTEVAARVMNFSNMTVSGNVSGGNVQANITLVTYYQGPANINSTFEPLK